MKTIEVVAAVIVHDGRVFATQRGYGDWKDWWEFPGGKIEPGETPEDALVREIREELDAQIVVDDLIQTIEWDYPAFHLDSGAQKRTILPREFRPAQFIRFVLER